MGWRVSTPRCCVADDIVIKHQHNTAKYYVHAWEVVGINCCCSPHRRVVVVTKLFGVPQPDVTTAKTRSKAARQTACNNNTTRRSHTMLVRGKRHMQQEATTSKEAPMVKDDDTMIDNGDDTIEQRIPPVVKTEYWLLSSRSRVWRGGAVVHLIS